MNKFMRAAATSQSLSLSAMEEASRQGRRTADLDDMLLALVLSSETAGQALRGLGITLDAAREAVADQHAAQLAELGIVAPDPEPGRITFHETGGFQWSDRAVDLIKRSGAKGMSGSASDILRLLVVEPSGLIGQLLARLGTSADEVIARLDELERLPVHTASAQESAMRSTSVELFVPAAVADVWALLADPTRMAEWDPSTGAVDAPQAPVAVGDAWTVHANLERPDGKPIRVHEKFRRRRVELLVLEEPTRIAWSIGYPDNPKGVVQRQTIELSPAVGGTNVVVSLAWPRSRGWRRLAGLPLRPMQRFLIWLGLWQLGGQISRLFR